MRSNPLQDQVGAVPEQNEHSNLGSGWTRRLKICNLRVEGFAGHYWYGTTVDPFQSLTLLESELRQSIKEPNARTGPMNVVRDLVYWTGHLRRPHRQRGQT